MCVCNGIPNISKQNSIIEKFDKTIEEMIKFEIEIDNESGLV